MTEHFGPITLKWDPKNLEIRTMSVEKTLEPLVLQVRWFYQALDYTFNPLLFSVIGYI